jgi:hypothetical protein
MRKYFPEPKTSQAELKAEGDAIIAAHHAGARRLARPPEDSKPNTKAFRPFDKLPSEEKIAAEAA